LYNDDVPEVEQEAILASGSFDQKALDPLFDKLKEAGPWGSEEAQFTPRQIGRVRFIANALLNMASRKCKVCAYEALPRLDEYLDAGMAPQEVLGHLSGAARRLSYADRPGTARLTQPALERLKKQLKERKVLKCRNSLREYCRVGRWSELPSSWRSQDLLDGPNYGETEATDLQAVGWAGGVAPLWHRRIEEPVFSCWTKCGYDWVFAGTCLTWCKHKVRG
jgi:hypothetical protein